MDEVQTDFSSLDIKISPYSNKLLPVLIDKMKYSPYLKVKRKAIQTIGWVWNGDESVVKELETVKNTDSNELTRLYAKNALSHIELYKTVAETSTLKK